jgi:hypothetical protein
VRRTIYQILTARFAGEPVTPEEETRLRRFRPRERFWPYLFAGFGMADAMHKLRVDILRDLRHYTLAQSRYRIRALLHLLEEFAAFSEGRRRAGERHQILRNDESTESRRETRDELLIVFDAFMADHPKLKGDARAREFLKTHPKYRKVNAKNPEGNLIRRVQLARKKK